MDFLPRDGCPGPAVRELLRPGEAMERGIAIVAIDWLPWFSEVHDSSRCPDGEFGQRIDDVFASLENHHVIVASHYPLRSAGDRADLGRGMFIDILVNLYHLFKPRSELNLFHPEYVVHAEQVETALARHRPLVYAAGHDHSLQVFEGDEAARMHIVSGAGSVGKVTRVTDLPGRSSLMLFRDSSCSISLTAPGLRTTEEPSTAMGPSTAPEPSTTKGPSTPLCA